MSDVPYLKRSEVEDELKRLHRYRHRVLSAAFHARGERGEAVVSLDGSDVAFSIRPVTCELELRKELSHRRPDENLVLLLDWQPGRLAADLHARLAGGRVYPIDRGRQIARLFQTTAVSSEVLACRPLVDELLRAGRPAVNVVWSGSTLDIGSAWRGLLARDAGWDVDAGLTEESLLAHAARHEPRPQLAASLGPGTKAGDQLLGYLAKREVGGPLAPWIWRAWLAGHGKTFAALAFLFEPAARRWQADPALRTMVLTVVHGLSPALRDAVFQEPTLAERWGALAEPLDRRLDDEGRRALLGVVAPWITPDLADSVIDSRYVPQAFAARSRRLGRTLTAAIAPEQSRTSLLSLIEQARDDLDQLEKHTMASSGLAGERIARARMAVRLVGYLASRFAAGDRGGDRLAEEITGYGAHGPVFALAQHQVTEGAWVDHARQRARHAGEDELDRAIEAVVARVDAVRDADDARFGPAYAAYLTSGSPSSSHVVPIARALDHLAVAFLKDQPHRRLAVVLLDGMAWANAVELLQSAEAERFAPLRWSGGKVTPVLAALPTLTEISRSAFFAGKPIKAGDAADTSKDPERFAAHAGLRKIGIEDAPLLLKADVAAATGGLGKKARDLLASDARVVGLVINAIDDQLKGAKQIRVETTLDTIKPMRDLLEAATEGRRALLLVADHGHVRAERLVSVGYGTGAGKRYRYLGADEAKRAEEIELGRDAAWVAPGKAKVAMLVRECDSYGAPSATGEHGGASIAEVVAPAILVGSDVLRNQVRMLAGRDDPELDVAPFGRPDWWDLQLPKKAAARAGAQATAGAAGATAGSRRKKSEPKIQQVVLPGFEPPRAPAATVPVEAAPAPVVVAESPLLVALRGTRAFADRPAAQQKRYRELVAPRLALLVEAGGTMPADVFARRAGVLPTSLGGVVADMQEWVNFDGYMVVEHDPIAKRLTINLDILREYLPEVTGG